MKKFLIVFALCGAMTAAAIAAMRRDFTQTQIRIFTEMSDTPAYKSHSPNPVFPDGRTLHRPVAGTIPRGYAPVHFADSPEDRKRAGRELANPVPPTLEALAAGKRQYENYCMHCHGRSGRGDGAVARTVPTLSMPISGKATGNLPDGELFHILTWGRNNMPPHGSQVRIDDRWKIVLYLRQLQGKELDRIQRLGLVYEDQVDPRQATLVSAEYGAELFQQNCVSCHGEKGRVPVRGVPTLNHPRVLAVADDGFYLDIITHGRKGTAMVAWAEILTPTQLRSVVQYIRSWVPTGMDRSRISTKLGDVERGRALFRGNCAGCHGLRGEGGIGNTLNRPSFQALASDQFLRDTIALGRKHTAMPSGAGLKTEEISDLMAFLRSLSPPKHNWAQVRPMVAKGEAKVGKKLYAARCAACHGKTGEGGIGSRLNSDALLGHVDDEFLYRAIVEGRPNTAMPAWRFLEARDVADLIAFLRGWQTVPAAKISRARRLGGRPEFGRILFDMACLACHGPGARGGVGAQLANPVFLDSATDEFLWHMIAYGKPGTAMRGFLKDGAAGALMPMSSTDIDDVIAYFRELQAHPAVDPPMRVHQATSIERGKEVYDRVAGCAKCHGAKGEGGVGPALGNPEFLKVASDGYLIGTIILGRENTEMLPYSRGGNVALSQEQVEDVVAYVRSLEAFAAKARREVERSASSVAEGRELYLSNCAGCHGSDGKGADKTQLIAGYAPVLHNPEFLRVADDGFLLATIALGRPGTPMRAFARGAGGIADLSANEMKKIVAYLRSWQEPEQTKKEEKK